MQKVLESEYLLTQVWISHLRNGCSLFKEVLRISSLLRHLNLLCWKGSHDCYSKSPLEWLRDWIRQLGRFLLKTIEFWVNIIIRAPRNTSLLLFTTDIQQALFLSERMVALSIFNTLKANIPYKIQLLSATRRNCYLFLTCCLFILHATLLSHMDKQSGFCFSGSVSAAGSFEAHCRINFKRILWWIIPEACYRLFPTLTGA